ncbi:hypothetical protein [Actinoplanes siamensis]|nr:hypothetical protein [Actinoplanes siamensis]
MSPRAHLAYGYDLGGAEDFKAAERDEYGSPKLPWFPDDDSEVDDFGSEAEKILLASAGFAEEWTPAAAKAGYYDRKRDAEKRCGVELDTSGHYDHCGWVLIAKGSEQSVEWSQVMALDSAEMQRRPAAEGWDAKLRDALTALGITPTQDGPKWLVYPSYG